VAIGRLQASGNTALNAGGSAAPAAPVNARLLTGPREHWFLSADVLMTNTRALSVNETSGDLELAEKPSQFHAGINFLLGDLPSERRPFWSNLVLKAFITVASRPLDSFGLALGMRGSFLEPLGLDLDILTPFVGCTFALEGEKLADGSVKRDARRSKGVFGVSLNLDNAIGWASR
jgi:hypothetical protein